MTKQYSKQHTYPPLGMAHDLGVRANNDDVHNWPNCLGHRPARQAPKRGKPVDREPAITIMGPFAWLGLILILQAASGMLYMPEKGLIWDPSCVVHKQQFYCFFMYKAENSSNYHQGYLARSADGVHFTQGEVIGNTTSPCVPSNHEMSPPSSIY